MDGGEQESKGMLTVEHLTPKLLMAVNYCGCQLGGRFGWVAPAYIDPLSWYVQA